MIHSADATAGAASVSYGAALTFETLVEESAPLRVHRAEDTLLRVIAGAVRLVTDEGVRVLATGEEAIIAAGTPHRLAAGGGVARIVTGFRAARR